MRKEIESLAKLLLDYVKDGVINGFDIHATLHYSSGKTRRFSAYLEEQDQFNIIIEEK